MAQKRGRRGKEIVKDLLIKPRHTGENKFIYFERRKSVMSKRNSSNGRLCIRKEKRENIIIGGIDKTKRSKKSLKKKGLRKDK